MQQIELKRLKLIILVGVICPKELYYKPEYLLCNPAITGI